MDQYGSQSVLERWLCQESRVRGMTLYSIGKRPLTSIHVYLHNNDLRIDASHHEG